MKCTNFAKRNAPTGAKAREFEAIMEAWVAFASAALSSGKSREDAVDAASHVATQYTSVRALIQKNAGL